MRKLLLATCCVVLALASASQCRNVVADDEADASKITPTKRRSRQSKEMKLDLTGGDDERHQHYSQHASSSSTLTAVADGQVVKMLSNAADDVDDVAVDDVEDVSSPWARLLEDWVVSNPTPSNSTDRHSRQMHMYNTMARFGQPMPPPPPPSHPHNNGGFYIKRRMGEAAPHPPPPPSTSPPARNDRQHPPTSPNAFRPLRPLPPALNFEQIRQTSADISETDLYLLSAIEKLVHRVDYLEKRLQTTDKLILHLLNDVRKTEQQQRPTTAAWTTATPSLTSTTHQQAISSSSSTTASQTSTTLAQSTVAAVSASTTETPTTTTPKPPPSSKPTKPAKPATLCPPHFTAIRSVCYHFNTSEQSDWKSANAGCRRLGAQLAEFGTARELRAVSEHLLGNNGTRYTEGAASFWLGGLNPGLLWIWSSSAKPVNTATNLAAFSAPTTRNSTTVIPPKTAAEPKPKEKTAAVFDIQGNGRCLNLQLNRALRRFEYYGEDCSRPLGFVCEQRNRQVENEIARVFRALRLD